MSNDTKNEIIKALYGAEKKASKLKSIEEKRQHYRNYLSRVLPVLDIDESVDPNSEEINQLIDDNFISITVEKPQIFEDTGYIPWLDDARNNIDWKFYDRYEKYLLEYKHWKPKDINTIKTTSDIILDHMANPKSDKYFHKKGLVIGDIQSGKTANYTAVINKAIDAGYKIVIVFAGLTKDLRNQTQMRIDSEVLGYKTKMNSKGDTTGVGLIRQLNVEGLTCSDDKKDFGDMKKTFSTHTLDKDLNPIVAIVKKNKSILQHLNKFLTSSQSNCYTNGKLDIPVLIIDDEVDQASVDTKDSDSIENASAINKQIRTILDNLNRYSYVGYTATPFAYVFIDPDKGIEGEGEDIYPKDFILCIPSNDDYCGIKEYFGVDATSNDDNTNDHMSDLFVKIDDYNVLFSHKDRIDASTSTDVLNNSLKDAIKSFIIASSIKKARGFDEHNSMLIHIARFKNPSTTLRPLVSKYVGELYHYLKYEQTKAMLEFKNAWENSFETVSKKRLGSAFNDEWNKIKGFLLPTVESALNNILVLNGDSGDVLDYSSSKTGDYIVIGGDKLSRGLTLEGLVVSYYYRRSQAYDSLLQMGRWFGYKKGWIDVCRVYTTTQFLNDFITVGKVLQKFRSDMNEMYIQRLNPREVGQRILYSPNLIPTARNKMRKATKLKVSFSGEIQQIITFDRKFVADNLDLTRNFIMSLSLGEVHTNKKVVFRNIGVNKVLDYLKAYKECSSYYGYGHISILNWIKYIENLNLNGELKKWTIVLNSLSSRKADYDNSIKIGNYDIFKPARSLRDAGDSSKFDLYTIKTNNDPTDFKEFFPLNSKQYNEIDHYNPQKDYPGFNYENGLMSIYVVDLFEKELTGKYDQKTNKEMTKRGRIVPDGISVSAPAIWFPNAKDYEKSATYYYVSKDYLDREKKQEENNKNEFGGEEDA